MLQVRIHGPGDVRLDEVPEPDPGPRDAVLRVSSCGICGSDLGYIKLGGVAGPRPEPMPLGHELAGLVEWVGAEVEGVAIGDRVTFNPAMAGLGETVGNGGPEGGFSPLLLVRGAADGGKLFPIPDSMPFEIAALTEPLGVGMNAVDKASVAPGDKVVVFGAGPIGLAAVATLHYRGIEDVVSVDMSDHRLGLAKQLGARETLNAGAVDVWKRLRELHGETRVLGAPCAASTAYIEASGAPSVIPDVIAGAGAGARLSIVAVHRAPIETSYLLILMKELQINGAIEYPDDYTQAIDLLANADVSPLITHHFPLERFPEALAVAQDPSVAGKVMIDVSG